MVLSTMKSMVSSSKQYIIMARATAFSITSRRMAFFSQVLYGDNVFEKCGINRDGAGEVGKPRYFNGKRHF